MAKREPGLPGEYRSRFTVTAPVSQREGGSLKGHVTYVGTLIRLDGRWRLELQWVDLEDHGHRVELPHEAVNAVLAAQDRLLAKARSERGKRASETARMRGVVPFQRKDAQEG